MAESPRASVTPDWVQDDDLWFRCGYDPTLYVQMLREQGRLVPPWGGGIKTNTLHPPADLPQVRP